MHRAAGRQRAAGQQGNRAAEQQGCPRYAGEMSEGQRGPTHTPSFTLLHTPTTQRASTSMLPPIQNELKTLNLALHFLTRIPTPFEIDYTPERLSSASRYYPIVGAVIGSVAALAFFLASLALPTIVAVLIATAATALLTGAFHEDGLADTFDGISGAYDRARSLEIMTDSRIGTFGALALIIVISTKVAALSSLADTTTITALIAAHIISRASIVIVQATSTYARETGIAGPQDQPFKPINATIATVTALLTIIAVALIVSPTAALLATAGAITGHILIRLYFQPKLKGHTGDTLGATQQITELAIYIALATL